MKINEELVSKVKIGKAAIEHNLKSKDAAQLRELLSVIFPKDNEDLCLGNRKYYYSQLNFEWGSDDVLPKGMEAIPLSSFFTEEKAEVITPSDKELINEIEKKVDRLYKAMFPEVAPIAPVEPNTIAQTEPIKEESKPYVVVDYKKDTGLFITVKGFTSDEYFFEIADKIKQLLTTL